jgi:hypothetical protein
MDSFFRGGFRIELEMRNRRAAAAELRHEITPL